LGDAERGGGHGNVVSMSIKRQRTGNAALKNAKPECSGKRLNQDEGLEVRSEVRGMRQPY